MENKKAQVTIFIIVGIVLLGAIILFFSFSGNLFGTNIPSSIEPFYNSFSFCVEEQMTLGASVLATQGGYLELPEFEGGSKHMPFSSQFDFLGNSIPYWYYVSGNNIQKEQVPSKREMEKQLESFLEDRVLDCLYYNFSDKFEINAGNPKAVVSIGDKEISLNLDLNLDISSTEENFVITKHDLVVDSFLGTLYDSARKIYEHEQETLFLETYGLDVLRLYAPVDGVELTCSPKTWVAEDVLENVQKGLESNILALKVKDGNYELSSKEDKYFVVDTEVEGDVRFINSQNWPYSFDIAPTSGDLLMSNPVGNQEGLGVLGFCYVPYHFVYDLKYPVLVQISKDMEVFQFPLAVVISGNSPREALKSSSLASEDIGLCENKNTFVSVGVYDSSLNPIDADISYECFGISCEIGSTSNGNLRGSFPQCLNGYILASAEGYKFEKYLFSSTDSGRAEIILDKLYEKEINLEMDGREFRDSAIITFVSENFVKSVVYPEQKSVELSEGQYEIQVYAFRNSSIKISETTKEQCVEIPQSGVGGFFGLTKEKCFDISFPAQIISNALSGGGVENYYVLEEELQNSIAIDINAESLPRPDSLEQLQENYILYEENGLEVKFR